SLVPTGKVYVLSNASGHIDVVSMNVDGTARQTVVAGTGQEDPNATILSASADARYLALLARRAGVQASLYLVDTATNKLSVIDEGDATFSLVGWIDHDVVFTVWRNRQVWEDKRRALKTFDASTGDLRILDETSGYGTFAGDAVYEELS